MSRRIMLARSSEKLVLFVMAKLSLLRISIMLRRVMKSSGLWAARVSFWKSVVTAILRRRSCVLLLEIGRHRSDVVLIPRELISLLRRVQVSRHCGWLE